jgi:hypothetical protein
MMRIHPYSFPVSQYLLYPPRDHSSLVYSVIYREGSKRTKVQSCGVYKALGCKDMEICDILFGKGTGWALLRPGRTCSYPLRLEKTCGMPTPFGSNCLLSPQLMFNIPLAVPRLSLVISWH